MNEWELKVSQKEIHRIHVGRLTIEKGGKPWEEVRGYGGLCTAAEAVAT